MSLLDASACARGGRPVRAEDPLAAELAAAIPGYRLAYDAPFFREFVLECPVEARR
jgi:hypothetical protein